MRLPRDGHHPTIHIAAAKGCGPLVARAAGGHFLTIESKRTPASYPSQERFQEGWWQLQTNVYQPFADETRGYTLSNT
jgi:hypothetical protein